MAGRRSHSQRLLLGTQACAHNRWPAQPPWPTSVWHSPWLLRSSITTTAFVAAATGSGMGTSSVAITLPISRMPATRRTASMAAPCSPVRGGLPSMSPVMPFCTGAWPATHRGPLGSGMYCGVNFGVYFRHTSKRVDTGLGCVHAMARLRSTHRRLRKHAL